jgi:hypothetical protein
MPKATISGSVPVPSGQIAVLWCQPVILSVKYSGEDVALCDLRADRRVR